MQTDTQTHRVTSEGTLSRLQDFFLQPIIKDRSNMQFKIHPFRIPFTASDPSKIHNTNFAHQYLDSENLLPLPIRKPGKDHTNLSNYMRAHCVNQLSM